MPIYGYLKVFRQSLGPQDNHTCDNFMMTMREICFSDEGDWGLNEGDFLTTCSSCFSYHFHMV